MTLEMASRAWPLEPATGRGRSHGTSSTEPFDRWFRYPAGFASDYVTTLLDHIDLRRGTVVDCFGGSGVTGTAARKRGLSSYGIEAHPMIAELAALKLAPIATGAKVRSAAATVVQTASTSKAALPLGDETDLVRRSFSTETLELLVLLRALVQGCDDQDAAAYLKWALLGTLRDVAGVKVGWPYQRPGIARRPRFGDPLARFAARVEMIASDLDWAATAAAVPARVVVGDSRDSSTWQHLAAPAEACIASPPYLNNFDYADATRLELYFWGAATSWREMCTGVRADMITATTQQSSVGEKADALRELQTLPIVGEVVAELVGRITDVKVARQRRSKEYDQVVPAYFHGIAKVLRNLKGHLADNATVVWLVGDSAPYGVYVDTPQIISLIAASLGFEPYADVQLRRRGNRWGNNPDRHNVPLSERLVAFRAAG